MPNTNRQILLASRPVGEPKPSDFKLVEAQTQPPGAGQVLCRTVYLSLDPYMRGRMNAGKSYAKPVEIGSVMEGGTVGQVLESQHPEFSAMCRPEKPGVVCRRVPFATICERSPGFPNRPSRARKTHERHADTSLRSHP